MEVGIDIEQTSRFELDKENQFIKDNFTLLEREYAFSKTQPSIHLAGIFCAKEAIKKLNKSFKMIDVEIGKEESGKPIIIHPKEYAQSIKISISHCKSYAVAIAISNENKNE